MYLIFLRFLNFYNFLYATCNFTYIEMLVDCSYEIVFNALIDALYIAVLEGEEPPSGCTSK